MTAAGAITGILVSKDQASFDLMQTVAARHRTIDRDYPGMAAPKLSTTYIRNYRGDRTYRIANPERLANSKIKDR